MNKNTEQIVRWLTENDETCWSCRKSLRGATDAQCPRCGIAFDIGVRPPIPLAAYYRGLTSLMIALGANLAMLIWLQFDAPVSARMANLGFLSATGAIGCFWLWGWPRFATRRPGPAAALAWGCTLFALASVLTVPLLARFAE